MCSVRSRKKFKHGYNEHTRDRLVLVSEESFHEYVTEIGLEIPALFLRYRREFVITVIVIAKFDCNNGEINYQRYKEQVCR